MTQLKTPFFLGEAQCRQRCRVDGADAEHAASWPDRDAQPANAARQPRQNIRHALGFRFEVFIWFLFYLVRGTVSHLEKVR